MPGSSTNLDAMHEIVVSDPVSWWPLAPGWYLVLLLLLMALMVWGARWIKRWRETAYLREALTALEAVPPGQLPELVKCVCLTRWPREQVASLSGDQLLQWLDRSGKTQEFTQGPGQLLLELSYQPQPAISREDVRYQQLIETVRRWLRQCRSAL